MESIHVQWRSDPSMAGVLNMKFFSVYLSFLFLVTLGLGAWVNDFTARQCVARTGQSYQECNR